MDLLTLIIALFFFFLFKWIFRILFVVFITKLISGLKEKGKEALQDFERSVKGDG
jgi:hypothetical protein